MIKVFIVDDDRLVQACFSVLLASAKDIRVVAAVFSGEEALEKIPDFCPDIVLMDIYLPGIDGIEATQKILARFPDVHVLIVTGTEEISWANKALQAGARGYLKKTAGYKEMLRAIKTVYAGQRYLMGPIAQHLAAQHVAGLADDLPFSRLSEKERVVAQLVIEGKSPTAIGTMLGIETKTVNSYRYRIFKKLKVANNNKLTRLALQYNIEISLPTEVLNA